MQEVPYGYCHCGCGQKTKVSSRTRSDLGHVRGVPLKYINHHNLGSGENAIHWKGGRHLDCYGYITVRDSIRKKAVKEHILIAETANGGPLPHGAVVHHLGDKTDNGRIVVFGNQSEHAKHHINERALAACGNPHWRKCFICHQWDEPSNLVRTKSQSHYHKKCNAERSQLRRTGQLFTKGPRAKYNKIGQGETP